jgi:hypothetical protein
MREGMSPSARDGPPAPRAGADICYESGVSLYGIIADLRREHPTPATMQTLDLVVSELGLTRDNLKEAVVNLDGKPLPPGGKPVLDELVHRAREDGVYDLDYGPDPYDKPPPEPLDEGTAGIGAMLALWSLAGVALAVAATVVGLRAIFSSGSG